MKPPFTCSYDEGADCLYITGSDNRPATATHISGNMIARWASDNGELVGFTIWNVKNTKREHFEGYAEPKSDQK